MEDRGAGPREADDEHRSDDPLLGDRREPFSVGHVAETVDGVEEGAFLGYEAADLVQAGFFLERLEEEGEGFEERPIAQVIGTPGPPDRLGDDRVHLELLRRHRRHARKLGTLRSARSRSTGCERP